MRILIIDNTVLPEFWGSRDLGRFGLKVPGSTVVTRRGPHGDLPGDMGRFDRIVISGSLTSCLDESPWVGELDALIRQTVDLGKPILGVCYGHQALARALGGKQTVGKGKEAEIGWAKIRQIRESQLLKGLPQEFYSYQSHYEEVTTLAEGFEHLASSERCSIQAIQLNGRPVYGIQFHPEKSKEEAKQSFESSRKKTASKDLVGKEQKEKLHDDRVGETIFRNFFEL